MVKVEKTDVMKLKENTLTEKGTTYNRPLWQLVSTVTSWTVLSTVTESDPNTDTPTTFHQS